jgi:hypothetical protein
MHNPRRSTAQQQKLTVLAHAVWPVHENAQGLGQRRQVLNFVYDHQSVKARQSAHRLGQSLTCNRIFKIEVMATVDVNELTRQSGFPNLPRTHELDCPEAAQKLSELLYELTTFYEHAVILTLTMKNEKNSMETSVILNKFTNVFFDVVIDKCTK